MLLNINNKNTYNYKLWEKPTETNQFLKDFNNIGNQHGTITVISNPPKLFSSLNEFIEWLMIFVFIVIVTLRIQTIALFGGLNFNLPPTEYLYIHKQAFTLAHLQDLLSTFIAIAWFRMLKFLR